MQTTDSVHVTGTTPLYAITLRVARLRHKNVDWSNVRMTLLRKGDSPHTYHWPDFLDLNALQFGEAQRTVLNEKLDGVSVMDLIAGTYEGMTISSEYFTEEERDAILAWFDRHPYSGTTIEVKRLALPLPERLCPTDIGGSGGPADYYCFDREAEFDCPVRFWGYYDIDDRCLPYKEDGTLDEGFWDRCNKA